MFEEKSQQLRRFMLLADICLTVLMFPLAYWIRQQFVDSEADLMSHMALLPLIVSLWTYFLHRFRAYASPRTTNLVHYGWSVFRAIIMGLGVLLVLLFLLNVHYVSRMIIMSFAVGDAVALVLLRVGILLYFRRSLLRGENFQKTLIIGTGNRAQRLAASLRQHTEWGLDIIGHLDVDLERYQEALTDGPVVGHIDDISTVLKNYVVDEVIVAIPRAMIPDVEKIAHACEEEGVRLRFMADVFDISVARFSFVHLGDIPLLTLEPVAQDEWAVMVKRALDLTATILALPFILPLMLVTAIAIKLDSKGPVFFVQTRVGQNKRTFSMLKFRTMVVGSEKMQAELEHMNEAQGPIFKIANDPRVTRVGRFLRKTSLDEIPQLINVLRGEMSLVGPRPMSLRDVSLFDRGIQRKRFSVKPGLTCLWQVSGRSQLPFSKWLELDLEYISNWSLSLDLKILWKTVPVVLRGTGAV